MAIITQHGIVEKKEIDLVVKFPVAFAKYPVVIITGEWEGGPGGVERPDILHLANPTSFIVHSENRTIGHKHKYRIENSIRLVALPTAPKITETIQIEVRLFCEELSDWTTQKLDLQLMDPRREK